MKSILHILAAGLAMAVATAPTAASVKIATYSGTISTGTDFTGVFGTAGQDLAGVSYITTYTYDFSLGGYQVINPSFANSYGSIWESLRSPMIDSTVTINGITEHIFGISQAQVAFSAWTQESIIKVDLVNHLSFDVHENGEPLTWLYEENDYATAFVQNGGNSLSRIGSPNINISPTIISRAEGYMEIDKYNYLSNKHYAHVIAHFSPNATYTVSDVVTDPVGGVPEPATWALLIAGFGLTGATMRRRRTAVNAA